MRTTAGTAASSVTSSHNLTNDNYYCTTTLNYNQVQL
jgi:hypothetical protein